MGTDPSDSMAATTAPNTCHSLEPQKVATSLYASLIRFDIAGAIAFVPGAARHAARLVRIADFDDFPGDGGAAMALASGR